VPLTLDGQPAYTASGRDSGGVRARKERLRRKTRATQSHSKPRTQELEAQCATHRGGLLASCNADYCEPRRNWYTASGVHALSVRSRVLLAAQRGHRGQGRPYPCRQSRRPSECRLLHGDDGQPQVGHPSLNGARVGRRRVTGSATCPQHVSVAARRLPGRQRAVASPEQGGPSRVTGVAGVEPTGGGQQVRRVVHLSASYEDDVLVITVSCIRPALTMYPRLRPRAGAV